MGRSARDCGLLLDAVAGGNPEAGRPAGRTGLPIGLQLAADAGNEALLLAVGHAYQQTTDWHRRRAPLPDDEPQAAARLQPA
jgi:Asp-tRNA(Asn)/Glu-tRNA(Gln) amidotransferase A subunit family amidase